MWLFCVFEKGGDNHENKKVLNNNAILVSDGKNEKILIGTGIGFKRKAGQSIEENNSKIEKTFILHKRKNIESFIKIIERIPIKYLSLSADIVNVAKEKLDYEISETIYISLTDHIYNLVDLYKKGLALENKISWEIKKFYPNEYAVGLISVDLISQKLEILFDEYEAANIAMHFIMSRLEGDLERKNLALLSKKIKDIILIIRMHNRVEIDENSLAFDRFVTHLRYFFMRMENHIVSSGENPLLTHAVEKYPAAYETVKLVEEYLEVELQDDEQLYLTLHIQKLIE